MDNLLTEIEGFCERHRMSVWDFGEAVLKDRPFVGQLRDGREVRSKTAAKCREFMAAMEADRAA
jgi:hypothetical protein